jgi:hypothetical protein
MLAFDTGLMWGELPVHPSWGHIAPLFPLLGFPLAHLQSEDPPIQAA